MTIKITKRRIPARRAPCLGVCGRTVDLTYNPTGRCRKCRRKLEIKAGRAEYKKRRESKKE